MNKKIIKISTLSLLLTFNTLIIQAEIKGIHLGNSNIQTETNNTVDSATNNTNNTNNTNTNQTTNVQSKYEDEANEYFKTHSNFTGDYDTSSIPTNALGFKAIENTLSFAGTKANCDAVTFKLDVKKFMMNLINKAQSSILNIMDANSATPDKLVEAAVDTLVGGVCVIGNPAAALETGNEAMACMGKMTIGQVGMAGDGGIVTGYVYPVPTAAAKLSMNMDTSGMKDAGKCFASMASKMAACQNGSDESDNCAFYNCYMKGKKIFYEGLNAKIKGAGKFNSTFRKNKQAACEAKATKNNKILDAAGLNPMDKNSLINNFKKELGAEGIATGKPAFPDDMTDEEKTEIKKYYEDIDKAAKRNNANDSLKAEEEAGKAKLKELKELACSGSTSDKAKKAKIAVHSINLNSFSLDNERTLEKKHLAIGADNFEDIFLKGISLSPRDNYTMIGLKNLKIELYRYFLGFSKDEKITFVDAPDDLTFFNNFNKNKLISAPNSEFLILPDLNDTYLSAYNKVQLGLTLCNAWTEIPEDLVAYRLFLSSLNDSIRDNNFNYSYIKDFFPNNISTSSELYKTNFLQDNKIAKEITLFVSKVICPTLVETADEMDNNQKIADLKVTDNEIKNLAAVQKLEEIRSKLTKDLSVKEKEEKVGNKDMTTKRNAFAINVAEVLKSWKDTATHLEKNKSKIILWK